LNTHLSTLWRIFRERFAAVSSYSVAERCSKPHRAESVKRRTVRSLMIREWLKELHQLGLTGGSEADNYFDLSFKRKDGFFASASKTDL